MFIRKFKAYFAMGIKTCWLVIPSTETVTVYTTPDSFHTYTEGNVIDEVQDIVLPHKEIFE